MHVALYTPAWPLAGFQNGIVTFVHWMREELEFLGHRVSIFTGQLAESGTYPNVHLVKEATSSRLLRRVKRPLVPDDDGIWSWGNVLAASILKVHRRDPIDVIEMEESFGWAADVEAATHIPLLVKLHGPAFLSLVEEELTDPGGQERIKREGQALARASAIAAPSADTLAATLARYRLDPAIRDHVVNPLNTASTVPLWSREVSSRDTLLFVGRFDRRKGGDVMLAAFQQLLRERPQLRLIFVGPDVGIVQEDGMRVHFEAYLASLFPSAVRDRVEYLGRRPNTEIPALRASAAAVIVPSRWENQSYAAIEAMFQGCPVVASDVGGLPESVIHQRTGLLAQVGDSVDLANQLAVVLDQPALAARLGEAARRHVIERHSARGVAKQSIDLYKRVISGARSRQ